MFWISQCLLCSILATTTAYNYGDYGPPQNYRERLHTRRVDHEPTHFDYGIDRLQEQSETVRRPERPAPRMNERSIAVTSGIQRVQERERVRVQSWSDAFPRSENGSYKIVNSQLKYPSISNRRGALEKMSDTVVFPGQTSAHSLVPEVPKECQDLGICENIPNYPHDIINSIIAELGDKIERFKVEELEAPEIAQRIGPDDYSEVDLCNHRETIIKPEAAKNKNGDWYFILNRKENPLQGYRVEVCQSKGQPCAENIAFFSDGYTSVCKQKYVQRMMAAVDVVNREIMYDMPFRVPSCCSCVAIHTNHGKK